MRKSKKPESKTTYILPTISLAQIAEQVLSASLPRPDPRVAALAERPANASSNCRFHELKERISISEMAHSSADVIL